MWLTVLVLVVLLGATAAFVAPPLFIEDSEDEPTTPASKVSGRG